MARAKHVTAKTMRRYGDFDISSTLHAGWAIDSIGDLGAMPKTARVVEERIALIGGDAARSAVTRNAVIAMIDP
jgi:hypothetical protein